MARTTCCIALFWCTAKKFFYRFWFNFL